MLTTDSDVASFSCKPRSAVWFHRALHWWCEGRSTRVRVEASAHGGFGVKHLTVSRRVNCEVVVGTANNGLASANADMLEVAEVFKWAHWAVASMRCANHASARKPVQCRQCTLEDVIRQSPVQILMTIGYEVSIWHRVDLITVGARNTCVIIDAYKCVQVVVLAGSATEARRPTFWRNSNLSNIKNR